VADTNSRFRFRAAVVSVSILALFLQACAGAALRQEVLAVDLQSAAHHPYRLWISAPRLRAPRTMHPVVYLLDANLYFTQIASNAAARGAIVVGIGYAGVSEGEVSRLRFRDFTTPASVEDLAPAMRALRPELGGLDNFLPFLSVVQSQVRALLPVDSRCEILVGHSLAGLAVLHELYREPGAFDAYVAVSPSIWWADRALLREEAAFADRLQDAGRLPRLFVSVGAREETPPGGADEQTRQRYHRNRMIANAADLVARLDALAAHQFARMDVLPDLTHDSVAAPGFSRGIQAALSSCQHQRDAW
jgi:predicted alpha/beta superfamily hydrolase